MKFEDMDVASLEAGQPCIGLYILRSKELRKSQAGKFFLNLDFSDKTGTINAKVWDTDEEKYDELELHKLYYVKGRVDLWNNMPQLTVDKYKLAEENVQKRIERYVASAPESAETMFEYVENTVNAFKNDDLRLLVQYFLETHKDKLLYYPAAKSFHHAVRSGLLYHIVRMMKAAHALVSVYEGVHIEMLLSGIVLHDMEKLNELEANELGIAEYSIQGQLIGHISQGVSTLQKIGEELGVDGEIVMLLQHMILSHHGIPEYGSPKPPMTLEAELLHQLDVLDARVYDFHDTYQSMKPGEISEPVWSMEKRRIYKHTL